MFKKEIQINLSKAPYPAPEFSNSNMIMPYNVLTEGKMRKIKPCSPILLTETFTDIV